MAVRDSGGIDTEVDELKVINTSEGVTTALVGNRMQVKLDVVNLPEQNTPDNDMDYTVTYDVSAGAHKKVLLGNIPTDATISEVASITTRIVTPGAYTYNKTSGVKAICVQVIGGGGGGAAGGKRTGNRSGGGGGSGGGFNEAWFNGAAIPSSVSCTIGAAGVGGPSVTVDNTNSVTGGVGGATNFGDFLRAAGGNGGTLSRADTTVTGMSASVDGIRASGEGGYSDANGVALAGTSVTYAPAGGGGGGGATGAGVGTVFQPNAGGIVTWAGTVAPAAGVSSGSPTAGTAGTTRTNGAPGDGGGGGGSTDTAGVNGAVGGAGATPGGGGGGGGACFTGAGNSGAGGNGGVGQLLIIEFF